MLFYNCKAPLRYSSNVALTGRYRNLNWCVIQVFTVDHIRASVSVEEFAVSLSREHNHLTKGNTVMWRKGKQSYDEREHSHVTKGNTVMWRKGNQSYDEQKHSHVTKGNTVMWRKRTQSGDEKTGGVCSVWAVNTGCDRIKSSEITLYLALNYKRSLLCRGYVRTHTFAVSDRRRRRDSEERKKEEIFYRNQQCRDSVTTLIDNGRP